VDKEWNSTVQEIWLWLEVSIKDGHIIALVYIVMPHSLLQGTSLVTIAVATDLIPDIDAFARPSLDLHLHQLLNFFLQLIISTTISSSIALLHEYYNNMTVEL
jgi:hypothetical protein